MKALFVPKMNLTTSSTYASLGLLAMRLVMGCAFVLHGYGKITNPFGWMGPDAPVPGIFQGLAALSEFGGGIALVLGLLTPLACLGLLSTMAVAVFTHASKGDGFVGGFELALVYFSISANLFLMGPGRFSIDATLASKNNNKNQTPFRIKPVDPHARRVK